VFLSFSPLRSLLFTRVFQHLVKVLDTLRTNTNPTIKRCVRDVMQALNQAAVTHAYTTEYERIHFVTCVYMCARVFLCEDEREEKRMKRKRERERERERERRTEGERERARFAVLHCNME
jgi:hypothetical protein